MGTTRYMATLVFEALFKFGIVRRDLFYDMLTVRI